MKLLLTKEDQSTSRCCPYYFCTQKTDFFNITEKVLELPSLTKKGAKHFINYQHRLVSDLREHNQDNHVVMSSPLACENMWQSDFFIALENFFRIKELLSEGRDFIIICKDAAWRAVLVEEAKKQGYSIKTLSSPLSMGALFNKLYTFYWSINNVYQAVRNIIILSSPFMKKVKINPGKLDLLFFTTWFQATLKSYMHDKRDPFFGDLPSLIQEKKLKVALFCHIDNFKIKNIEELTLLQKNNIYTYHHFLNIKDVISIFWKTFKSNVCICDKYLYLKKCIKNDMRKTKWIQSLHALMIKCVSQRFMRANPGLKVIHTFEGNCWEKGIRMAEQELMTSTSIIYGYQHTGFSEFLQKLKAPHAYFPTKIISSGVSARHYLVNTFFHNKNAVWEGCHLRAPSFDKVPLKVGFPCKVANILVLLQGTPYDNLFLQKAAQYIDGFSGKVMVRLHPASQNQPLKLPQNFSISNGTLKDALLENDLVLHNGTTAALEAAYSGIPTVHLDLGFAYPTNILFDIKDNLFFQNGNCEQSFKAIVKIFHESEALFEHHLQNFRHQYQSFFKPPNVRAKEVLISLLEK